MTSDLTVYTVLSNYTALPQGVQAKRLVAAGGFSGSAIWRIDADDRSYCLRRWSAEHPDRERLTFIHLVLREAKAQGLDFVPAPLQTAGGATFIEHNGRFWELMPWMPGQADFWQHPSATRLAAAFTALARFHQATRQVAAAGNPVASAPAVQQRRDRLGALLAGGFDQLFAAVSRETVLPQLDSLLRQALLMAPAIGQRLLPQLKSACERTLAMQPAIRDIWHDHVLFTGDQVTGIIDYGAMRIDTPLTDIARLMGSLAEDQPSQRAAALHAYSTVAPLSADDRELAELLDHSTVLLSLANWAQWLHVEHRHFDDLGAVERRISKLALRLQNLRELLP